MKKALCIALVLLAPACCVYGQMKLLSPGVGWWVVPGPKLLWTNDNGAHWEDRTPRPPSVPKGAMFNSMFVRNASEGWAIVSYKEPAAALTPKAIREQKTLYSLAHTDNSGETWDAIPLNYPPLPQWEQDALAGPVSLFFVDSMHGWLDMGIESMSRMGKLLATEDGGQSWHWVSSPLHSGPIFFKSLKDGWLLSSWGADQLYVTHDGARSWAQVRLKRPVGVGSGMRPIFSEPHFYDSRNGYLPVEYAAAEPTLSKLVVYITHSGGRSWQPLKILSVPSDTSFAFTDSVIVLPTSTVPGELSTESVSLANRAQPARPVSTLRAHAITALSFVDASNGWAIKDGGLYATDDGGATWIKITPPAASPRSYGRTVVVHAPPPQIRGHR